MFELSMEFVMVLLVVGIVVAVTSSPRARATLLTIFGVLGFGCILLGLVSFVLFHVRSAESRKVIVHYGGTPEIQVDEIPLDSLELPPAKAKPQAKEPLSKSAPVKKRSSPTTTEKLPLQPADPIRIDDQTRADIERQWREGQLQDRLRYTGTGAAALLCVLATVFGYLKLDMLSRAKYRRGLQAGAAGVILAVTVVAALAAEGRLGF